jgi:hypothetical protein
MIDCESNTERHLIKSEDKKLFTNCVADGFTTKKLAEVWECTEGTIHKTAKRFGVKLPRKKYPADAPRSRKKAERILKYVGLVGRDNTTLKAIANHCDVTSPYVEKVLKENGIYPSLNKTK